jgi:predicted acetyltransferase
VKLRRLRDALEDTGPEAPQWDRTASCLRRLEQYNAEKRYQQVMLRCDSIAMAGGIGESERMFEFHDPGELIDGDLQLVLTHQFQGDPVRDRVPYYRFKMTHVGRDEPIGRIELRIGNTERILMYLGHIGYGVSEPYRGHRYAARGSRLLLPLARSHGFKELWITCNPDNTASRRTCEILGATLVEIVDIPRDSSIYAGFERQKCRYRLDL